ncbi:hypothetical protein BGZ61DRAFT_473041 [Ilyonectria robusta]|uniref:uncharacterized protein n=1 Tax=Ilyonectria robusta TaxID=1079257 RepID=UPI001E8DF3B9|nr:uncharacterized protein BGZ61DRAFT_473041 [Ilyonectria robusta]KAH8734298.1 hypothetical protein BGZ61DRAFT_473041 [Ilyonectria robusta]
MEPNATEERPSGSSTPSPRVPFLQVIARLERNRLLLEGIWASLTPEVQQALDMAAQAAEAELEGVDAQPNRMRDFNVSRAVDPKVSDLESRVSELVHQLEAARQEANVKAGSVDFLTQERDHLKESLAQERATVARLQSKAIDSAAEISRLKSVIEGQRMGDASIDQKVWARSRKKEKAIRALKTTSNSGMMTDRVRTGRRIEEVIEEIEDEDVDEPAPQPVDSNPGVKLPSESALSTRFAVERQAAPNPQGGSAPARTASNYKPKSPEDLFAALRAHRANAVKANPSILTEGFRAADRDEAQRHEHPLVNG